MPVASAISGIKNGKSNLLSDIKQVQVGHFNIP